MMTMSRRLRVRARHCSMYARKMGPFIAPSITKGATIPSWRNPATKVIVFQCPCGTECDQPLPARATTSEPHHVCAGSGLVDKHQPSGVKHALLSSPTSAGASDIGSFLLCRVQAFFLKLTLCRSKKRWRALRLPGMPCLAMAARISSRVKSGCLVIRAKIQSECSSNGETLPPLRFGAALPVSLQRWHHRTTELTPTLKISAISRRDAPLATASTARSRKSVEYGLGIDLAPQANQFPQIRLRDSGWESLRFNADGKCSSWHGEKARSGEAVRSWRVLRDFYPREPLVPEHSFRSA